MDKNAGQFSGEQMAAQANLGQAPDTPVTPVRSAKDAINAMYAQGGDNRLSSYLAASAKDIINANHSHSDHKSAASMHGSNSRQRLAVKPSASGILRSARVEKPVVPSDTSAAMDPLARKTTPAAPRRTVARPTPTAAPVVKTSLKLGPKKSPAVASARPSQPYARSGTSLNGTKAPTGLEKLMGKKRSASTRVSEDVNVMQRAARQATGQPLTPSASPAQPKRRTSRGMMQDIMRPVRPRRPATQSPAMSDPATSAEPASAANLPSDSLKKRFRAAPKGYTTTAAPQPNSYTGYDTADFTSAEPASKPPVEIYGLMDEEPTGGKSLDGLGVVEDYHPQGDSVTNSTINEQKVAQGSGKAAPDNNKYALGGQSPFFLKSVSVEKRPLSDAPIKNRKGEAGTLYEKPSSDPVSSKNIYAKKESKKPLPTKPTVIIPASRRSRAPLVILLILTVVLGAAVGAFIYLCFFQYME